MRTDKEQWEKVSETLTVRKSAGKKRAILLSVIAAVTLSALVLSAVLVLPGLLKKAPENSEGPSSLPEEIRNSEYFIRPERRDGDAYPEGGFAVLDDAKGGMALHDAAEIPGDYPIPAPDASDPVVPYGPGGDQNDYRPGQLTGAELRDRDNHKGFVADLNDLLQRIGDDPLTGLYARDRVAVTVSNGEKPLAGVKVELYGANADGALFTARTDNKGVAYLFYNVTKDAVQIPETVVCTYEGKTVSVPLEKDASGAILPDVSVQMQGENKPVKLDLMFMIDTTGSMGDELEYLKSEIKDIIANIYQNGKLPVCTSVNFYRDEYDEYIVHATPFTEDANEVYGYINGEHADGGGDTPEAVHTALNSAISGHAWDEDAVKLCFVVLDAPPHSEQEVANSLTNTILAAAAQGVRIIPIVSSGSDDLTEYVMRTYAHLTGGTYTFLTNHSGIGNPHADPTTKTDYEVEMLNEMIVRIVKEYCAEA